jgi:hypothetical protein
LNVRGGLVDVITKTTIANWDYDETASEIDGIMFSLIRQSSELTSPIFDYPTKAKIADVKYKTMIGNVRNTIDEVLGNHAKILEEFEAYLEESARGRHLTKPNPQPNFNSSPSAQGKFAARENLLDWKRLYWSSTL